MDKEEPLPDGTKFRSYLEIVHQLEKDFKVDPFPDSEGVFPHEIPSHYYISDRKYLTDGRTEESYRIFFELLLNIPFILMKVDDYIETYFDDVIELAEIGLPQPKIVYVGDIGRVDQRIYVSARTLKFEYIEPTDEEINQRIEKRKRDYINIVVIIWLINLLRSNPTTVQKTGLFKKEVVKKDPKTILAYSEIIEKIDLAYGVSMTTLILQDLFTLMGIDPKQFLASLKEA